MVMGGGNETLTDVFLISWFIFVCSFNCAGRADKDGYFNDIWAFNTFNLTWEDWTPDYDHSTAEFFPSKRDHHHVASVDGHGDGDGEGGENPKMILFGGRGEPSSQKHQHKYAQRCPLSPTVEAVLPLISFSLCRGKEGSTQLPQLTIHFLFPRPMTSTPVARNQIIEDFE